jgi:hypothetical protein
MCPVRCVTYVSGRSILAWVSTVINESLFAFPMEMVRNVNRGRRCWAARLVPHRASQ